MVTSKAASVHTYLSEPDAQQCSPSAAARAWILAHISPGYDETMRIASGTTPAHDASVR
ncbi:MAG: hypothetical protein GXY52_03800 [Chloroflexi bacterium]|nr:hypothetical protein [Chloroflexota bacterium]